MIPSASSDHYFHLKLVLLLYGQTYVEGRTDNMCENSDHYRSCLWVGRVDQLSRTPEWHEYRKDDCAVVVKQIGEFGQSARLVQVPKWTVGVT